MEQALAEARQQRELEASRKRQALSDEISTSAKRRRLDLPAADAQVFATPDNPLATFDATSLPLPIVIDLIVNNFQGIDDATFTAAIEVRILAAQAPPIRQLTLVLLGGPTSSAFRRDYTCA